MCIEEIAALLDIHRSTLFRQLPQSLGRTA
jgi:transcriptional regulator of acetoin/glycerol metabolism